MFLSNNLDEGTLHFNKLYSKHQLTEQLTFRFKFLQIHNKLPSAGQTT